MALPRIAAYAPLEERELPANRVSWKPDPSRCVLLVHDMQNHFVRAFEPGGASEAAVQGIAATAAACRRAGIPVVYSAQPGGQSAGERGLQLDMWGWGVGSEPGAADVVDELSPQQGDLVLRKWRYNAFHRTDLAGLLEREGRDQLLITGVYGHIGVQSTAADAFMRDVQAFVVADAVADFSREEHLGALRWVAGRAGVVLHTEGLLTHLA